MLRCLACLILAMFASLAGADEWVDVCYGYGCLVQTSIRYRERELREVGQWLAGADSAAEERERLAGVIGRLYRIAGEQSEIHNDRGGNYADEDRPGKMDCIDHSTSSMRLLEMLVERGFLRWHRVGQPVVRYFALVFPAHWSATIEEKAGGEAFVVDSWFVDNGEPAVILPLEDWKKGAGPDV